MAPPRALFVAGLLLVLISSSAATRNVFGSCPQVRPMKDFDMSKFAGVWYVVESFDNRVKCMQWDISQESEDVWHIKETKQSGLTREYNGKLTLDKDSPAALSVSWSINVGGSYPFTVFATDYDNVAGVFMCQRVIFYSRQQGIILSRTPVLSSALRQGTAGRLTEYIIDMAYFYRVDQGASCGWSSAENNTDEAFLEHPYPGGAGLTPLI